MLKSKKRPAENNGLTDEPVKKKSLKKNTEENYEESAKTNVKKFDKNIKKLPSLSGKPVNKFARTPQSGKEFGKKLPNKGPNKSNSNEAKEKRDWKKFKQDKKELKQKRKQAKTSYEVSLEAKILFEKLKCRKTEKKNELVEKLFNLVSSGDLIKKFVVAHDTARIIQCMLKHASPSLREQLSERLLPLSVEMCVSKYSHFCVLRMFKYGSPLTKSKLVDSFLGNILKLATHNISSKILDQAYLTVANAKQKMFMRQELYSELYKKMKDDNITMFKDTFKDTPNMKVSMLNSLKANLDHIANKQLIDSSLVHAVLLEYLTECEEDKLEETITGFATLIPMMITTKEGCQAAIICFYKSSSKNRRAIIKNIKEHLVKISTHEHGHLFLLALLNSLDDTKAIKKAIYDNLHPELQTLMSNQWGRRVVEWLISPADTNCFHPTFIASLEDGLKYGKKDKDIRRKEIFEQIEVPITEAITNHPDFWVSEKRIGLVTATILKKLNSENFVKCVTALSSVIANPEWSVNVNESNEQDTKNPKDVEQIIAEATKLKKKKNKIVQESEEAEETSKEESNEEVKTEKIPGIEDAGLHIVLKKILRNDKTRLAEDANVETFGSILLKNITAETLTSWLKVNRACFILVNIFENNESTIANLTELIKPHLKVLKKQSISGAKLLIEKLSL